METIVKITWDEPQMKEWLCPDNIKLCTDLGINGYPTWIDAAGKKYEGEQGLAGIAKITGCELPK